jgi:hypothetical protein
MQVSTLPTGSALSRTLPEGREGSDTVGQIGAAWRFDSLAAKTDTRRDGLSAVTGNRMDPPLQGGKMEAPRALAAERMEQVAPESPGEDAMSAIMALLMKFQKMQDVVR